MSIFNRQHRTQQLEAATAALIGENDALRVKVANLQKENRHLRRRLPNSELRILRRARLDAELLIAAHFGGLPTSRRESGNLGISARRWNWATALLDIARVRHCTGAWRTDDPADIAQRLAMASAHVTRHGIEALAARTAKNGYSGQKKRVNAGNAPRPKRDL